MGTIGGVCAIDSTIVCSAIGACFIGGVGPLSSVGNSYTGLCAVCGCVRSTIGALSAIDCIVSAIAGGIRVSGISGAICNISVSSRVGGMRTICYVSAIGNSGVGGCDVRLNSCVGGVSAISWTSGVSSSSVRLNSGVGAISSLNTGSLLRGNHCGALASS